MNWDNARFFLAVARTGTLRGAAAQLNVDQATVGRRIAALEESLSATLFLRMPTLFVLTPAGEALLGPAGTMEQAALVIERRVAGLDSWPEPFALPPRTRSASASWCRPSPGCARRIRGSRSSA